ncbi:MAG: RNA polymerase sigma factor [Rhodocyclaceae bacterium]|nr:RNA polymerase sigma factor [Rhodocyclaceae bacterium]
MQESIHPSANDVPSPQAALVAGIVSGEPHAFERMMRQHNRRLFRVARSILGDDAEAEDALQDGYIHAYRAMADFRGESQLATWLTRIIVNQALERKRRRRIPVETEGDIELISAGDNSVRPETPESLAIRGELRRLIESSIDGLPATYRTVFILRAVEGLSVEETAASLGISQANTKTRFLRARAQLRDALGQHLGPLLENVFAFDGRRCDRIVSRVCARLGLAVSTLPDSRETLFHRPPEGDHHDCPHQ